LRLLALLLLALLACVAPSASGSRTVAARDAVVGGSNASIADFPFLVALYDPSAGSPAAGFFCGGVILDATHVVTAAHCIVEASGRSAPAGRIAVLAGSTTLAPLQSGSVTDPVLASTFDARYDPSTSDYDVGLLKLARPLWAGQAPPSVNGVSRIAPLALDAARAAAYGDPNVAPPVTVTASGWGDLSPAPADRPSYPLGLRAVRMPLVPDEVCEQQYTAIEQPITARMICAGGGRSHLDTCYGDSGGPLLADSQTPAHPPQDYVLVGLVDFGNGCAQSDYAGVYTRISSPEVMRFLSAGVGRAPRSVLARVRHKKKRHRRQTQQHRRQTQQHRRQTQQHGRQTLQHGRQTQRHGRQTQQHGHQMQQHGRQTRAL
jgi:trypsin